MKTEKNDKKTECLSSWIFIKIVHQNDQPIKMREIDEVVRALDPIVSRLVHMVLQNHDIGFIKTTLGSNLINQPEGECE